MRDNRDPQLLGEQLLNFRETLKDKPLHEVMDIARQTGVAIGISEEQLNNFYNGNGYH